MLKEKRQEKGMSQTALADASGINLRMIQFYEQGKRDINGAKLKTLASLAVALNCKISEILDDEDLISLVKKATL